MSDGIGGGGGVALAECGGDERGAGEQVGGGAGGVDE